MCISIMSNVLITDSKVWLTHMRKQEKMVTKNININGVRLYSIIMFI